MGRFWVPSDGTVLCKTKCVMISLRHWLSFGLIRRGRRVEWIGGARSAIDWGEIHQTKSIQIGKTFYISTFGSQVCLKLWLPFLLVLCGTQRGLYQVPRSFSNVSKPCTQKAVKPPCSWRRAVQGCSLCKCVLTHAQSTAFSVFRIAPSPAPDAFPVGPVARSLGRPLGMNRARHGGPRPKAGLAASSRRRWAPLLSTRLRSIFINNIASVAVCFCEV